jgi:hypothetical protein
MRYTPAAFETLRRADRMLIAGALVLGIGSPQVSRAQELPGYFIASTIGARGSADLGPVAVDLSRTGGQRIGCYGTDGETRSRDVLSVSIGRGGGIMQAESVASTVFSQKIGSTAIARSTLTVAGLNMLGGLITADSIKSVANVEARAKRTALNAEGTVFKNLQIGGAAVPDSPRPNTRVDLPGIGHVIVNRLQRERTAAPNQRDSISVELLRIVVSQTNALALPVGARIVVGRAEAGFGRGGLNHEVAANAYIGSANTKADGLNAQLRRAGNNSSPCQGTEGDVQTRTTGAVDAGLVRIAGGKTTVFAGPREAGGVEARATAEIEGANLLGGLIRASSIKAVARDRLIRGNRISATDGSRVAGLRIAGIPIGNVTTPNRSLDLPGVGSVIVNESAVPRATSRQPTVASGLRIVVSTENALGLPVGAEIVVGRAKTLIDGRRSGEREAQDHAADSTEDYVDWEPEAADEGV